MIWPKKNKPKKNKSNGREGVATVEFAICLPILVLIILGSIEACNMIFLKQALTEAAYQGALSAMKREANESQVEGDIQAILTARQISGTNITIANNQLHKVKGGDTFTIEIDASVAANRICPAIISIGALNTIESTVTALKQ